MYKQDYDGYYPFAEDLVNTPSYTWYFFLGPYIKNSQVTLCPDDPSSWTLGYSYNWLFGYFPGGEASPSRVGNPADYKGDCGNSYHVYDGINESTLSGPATTILITEASLTYNDLLYFGTTPATAATQLEAFAPEGSTAAMVADYYFPGRYDPDSGIHSGGCNNVYADGHAKWQQLDSLMVYTIWCP